MFDKPTGTQSKHAVGRVTARNLWFLAGGVTIALLLFCFGTSKLGVPAISIGPTRVKPQIAVKWDQVFMVAPDGSLWVWGKGSAPNLGIQDATGDG